MKLLQIGFIISALHTAGSLQAQIVAQFTPSSHYFAAFAGANFSHAGQTFISDVTGRLGQVSFLFTPVGSAPANIIIDFRDTSAGLPLAVSLGSVVVDTFAFSSTTLVSADFSSLGLHLLQGSSYGLVLGSSSLFGLEGANDGYAGGQQVISFDGSMTFVPFPPPRDLYFSVSLAPGAVPEPATYGLVGGLTLAGIILLRRRRPER